MRDVDIERLDELIRDAIDEQFEDEPGVHAEVLGRFEDLRGTAVNVTFETGAVVPEGAWRIPGWFALRESLP